MRDSIFGVDEICHVGEVESEGADGILDVVIGSFLLQ
jgi:hypothetical protein